MRLLIIGGVAAGLSAAARARRLDKSLEIVVLEKGRDISYSACGLPYYLEGRVGSAAQLITYTPEYFRKERNITVRTGAKVVSILHSRREVALEAGERLHYDKLVIATGARPDIRGIEGSSLPHVFTLHTLNDAERLKRFLTEKRPRRAVVIGAGYIGLEAADALRRNGLTVTVLEQGPHVLGREDAWLTDFVRRHMKRFRVDVRCGEKAAVVEEDRVAGMSCDLVVLAPGLLPNTELATEAGIQVGASGAIHVDDRMTTNLGAVFAAGDCAETINLVTGRPAYIPLGTTANKMGRVAGANAAGARERFPGVVGTSIVKLFGIGFAMTGLSEMQARREGFAPVAARIESYSHPRYLGGKPTTVELVADRNSSRLLGGVVIGEEGAAGRINVIAAALHGQIRTADFEQMDLAYTPPYAPVWDPLLICAQQLLKAL